jgi:DNA-binding CsgD family transcriptional regulator
LEVFADLEMPIDHESLVDRIYEAAVIPEFWPDVLDRLSQLARCYGGALISLDAQREARYFVSEPLQGLMDAFLEQGWNKKNLRFERLAPRKYPGFVTDLDVITREEMETSPYYTDFVRPNGGGFATGTIIAAPTDDHLVFNFERRYEDGPIEREICGVLDTLRPHLARASLMSVRLRMERARGMVDTLGLLGLPAAVLRRNGRSLAANAAFEALDKQFKSGAFDSLTFASPSSNALFYEALEQLQSERSRGGSRSIPVPAVGDHLPAIAHLMPVRGAANDIFARAFAVLVVTPLAAPSAPADDVLNGLFDLTPAEARVTQGIVRGETIDMLAIAIGVSRETIRTQLKAAMVKTGTSRQAELVGLLASVQMPGT